jgi:hypothetical protein
MEAFLRNIGELQPGYAVSSQKMVLFIATAVRTSDPI